MISDFLAPILAIPPAVKIEFFAGLIVWFFAALRLFVHKPPARLAPWIVSPADFLACALFVVASALLCVLLAGAVVNLLSHRMPLSVFTSTVVANAAMYFGALVGTIGAWIFLRLPQNLTAGPDLPEAAKIQFKQPPRTAALSWPLAGVLTFLAAMPVVDLTSIAWTRILELLRLSPKPQEAVDLFAHARFSVPSVVLFLVATVAAPVVEEVSFRAGLFRYLRTRIPRWPALLLPALFFATVHCNWASFGPLAALAIVFSLAYERTGHIGVTMIAHALFNLNTILLILAGVYT